MLVLGVVAVAALLGVDPAVAGLLLDADLLVLLGSVGLAMLGADARVLVLRMRTSNVATLCRVSADLSVHAPRTLLGRRER